MAAGTNNPTAAAALDRVDRLISKGQAVLATHTPNPPNMFGFATLDSEAFAEWGTQSVSYLENLLGPQHTYTTSLRSEVERGGYQGAVRSGIGVLRAVREDVEGGYLAKVEAIVSAEVFSDLLEMAQHLLEAGYKDPAAMLAGAVLEDGLRRIATTNGVVVRRSDDLGSLSQKCGDANVFNRLVQKRLHVWTEVRNKAAHGEFDEYTADDVTDLLQGVVGFLSEFHRG